MTSAAPSGDDARPNEALWLCSRRGRLRVGPAPVPVAGSREIVVRVRAVAVNPVDAVPGLARSVIAPWLRYPTVMGSDVAGDVVDVGPEVTRFALGDRVLGHALSFEKRHNRPQEGAFQHHAVLHDHMAAPIPDHLTYQDAAVVPLGASTAACGLFEQHLLALARPHLAAPGRGQSVVVWGASTSVGSNAVQLAANAGYRVLATASPHNADYVRGLGAEKVVDYHRPTAVAELLRALTGHQLAGVLAIGTGSAAPCIDLAARADGARAVACAAPPIATALPRWRARRLDVRVGHIWGGTLAENDVGPAIYEHFLPAALRSGAFRPAPPPRVVGDGLDCIPSGLAQLRRGVSARKIVITLDP